VVETATAGVDEDLGDLTRDRARLCGADGARGEDLCQRRGGGALGGDVDEGGLVVEHRGAHIEDGGDAGIVHQGQPATGVQQVARELLVCDVEDDGVVQDRVEGQAHGTGVGGIRQPRLLDRGDDVPFCDDGTALDPHLLPSRRNVWCRDGRSSRTSTQFILPDVRRLGAQCHETGTCRCRRRLSVRRV
jgi:hypothetical protein